ncbi:hypothetical protein M8C21_024012 [Ambrosia artemisiifolia]|uniref:Uncharacterized protein n=1 Tax=Ambrosia artemisiifolia TaxID=4212 RepID=A0AAD5CXE5_AMBAR|nr:hypothetical protein M8C21_024012 [Ambrosia artemisiifolia]
MVVKMEAILDVVDPQPRWGKSLSMKRRTFDMQDGVIQKGVVEDVTQVFAKNVENNKRKEYFSPKAAAMMIQKTFSAYLLRKSQALRALRELAIVQRMLKEFATLFHLLHFHRGAAHDKENRLKFSEKFIVMLLAIDAIEGATIEVRATKRKMVYKLEAILNIMHPQPGCGKSQSLKRRKFDIQDGVIQNNVAEGATKVVRMRRQSCMFIYLCDIEF